MKATFDISDFTDAEKIDLISSITEYINSVDELNFDAFMLGYFAGVKDTDRQNSDDDQSV